MLTKVDLLADTSSSGFDTDCLLDANCIERAALSVKDG